MESLPGRARCPANVACAFGTEIASERQRTLLRENRLIRVLVIVLGLLVAVCGAYAGLLAWFDGERIRAMLGDRLSQRWGLEVRVASLERSFSLTPLIVIEQLRVANAEHSDEPLIEVRNASFRLHPWTLLVGPVTLDDIVIDGISVSVPVGDEGALYWDPLVEAMSNWIHRFDWSLPEFTVRGLHTESRHVSRGNDLLVSAETIHGGVPRPADLAFVATGVSANLETALPLRVKGNAKLDKVALQRQEGKLPVTFSASGVVEDKLLEIDAAGGNLLAGDPMERDPLEATIVIGEATAGIRGTMSRDDAMHLALHVTYDEPGSGDRPPLHVEAGVSDPGSNWRLTGVRARQGESTLDGILEIRNQDGRRMFDGSATVTHVEYPEPDEKQQGDEQAAEQEKGGMRQVLPEGDLFSHLLDGIGKFDADIELRAEQSHLLGIPFDRITIRTKLDDGALWATIEDSRIRESSLKGTFSVAPGEAETSVDLSAELRDAELSALIAGIDRLEGVTGRFDGDLSLHATGRDTAAVLGSTGGRLTLFLDDGAMPDELATKIAGDVLTAMFTDFDEDDKTPIRCALVDFDVDSGLASARRMMLNTGEFLLFGDGRINLQKGTLDVKFIPRAKDFSLVSMRLPFRIHGPLDDIRFNPDVSEGVASLLTPVELGTDEKVSCEPPPMAASRAATRQD